MPLFQKVRPELTREDARRQAKTFFAMLQEMPPSWRFRLENLVVAYLCDTTRLPTERELARVLLLPNVSQPLGLHRHHDSIETVLVLHGASISPELVEGRSVLAHLEGLAEQHPLG